MTLLVNSDRLQSDFEALSAIWRLRRWRRPLGRQPPGPQPRASRRPALVPRPRRRSRAWKRGGSGRQPQRHPARPVAKAHRTLLLGSHLDSVPNGGRYDGALGVLAGLEALRTIKEPA